MIDQVIIRKATFQDLDVLLKFEQGVIQAERPFDTTLKDDPTSYYDLTNMIDNEMVHLVVAEYQNEVIASGYARIEAAKPYLKHREHSYFGFMYVRPDFRGKGVNGKVIDALRQWSAEKSISEIRLDVYVRNEAAIRAYEKMSFARHMVQMRREV